MKILVDEIKVNRQLAWPSAWDCRLNPALWAGHVFVLRLAFPTTASAAAASLVCWQGLRKDLR